MKFKLTALLLALIMVLQVSGLSAFAQQTGENLQESAVNGEISADKTDGNTSSAAHIGRDVLQHRAGIDLFHDGVERCGFCAS